MKWNGIIKIIIVFDVIVTFLFSEGVEGPEGSSLDERMDEWIDVKKTCDLRTMVIGDR